MNTLKAAVAGAALLFSVIGIAFAEDAHHPNQPSTAPTTPTQSNVSQPGMAGQGVPMPMMNMMGMMNQAGMAPMMAMMGPNGMMVVGTMGSPYSSSMGMDAFGMGSMGMSWGPDDLADYVEGRLAFLKAELKITDAQTPKWNTFADVLRKVSADWRGMRSQMAGAMNSSPDLPTRFQSQRKFLEARLGALREEEVPLLALYATLSEAQKRTADVLISMPRSMGGMAN